MNAEPETPDPEIPTWVVARLEEAFYRVQNVLAGGKLWHERFTDADRARFAQPWPDVWAANQGTIGLWCRARGTSWNRGIAEVAHVLGFLDEAGKNALVAALPPDGASGAGLVGTQRHRDVRPSWRKQLGELRYRGEVVRQVKSDAANVRRILDAFETDGWPDEIYDPFPPKETSASRRRAVETLNRNLRLVRFKSTGNGTRIGWQPIDEANDAPPPT